jgi:hypothetical protein
MPVEIRELQINVTVNQQGGAPGATPEPSPGGGKEDEKKALVNQCVDQVLEILNNKKER